MTSTEAGVEAADNAAANPDGNNEKVEELSKTVVENIKKQVEMVQQIACKLDSIPTRDNVLSCEQTSSINLIKIIIELCNESTCSTILNSGLVSACISAIECNILDPVLFPHFISVLDAIVPHSKDTVVKITDTNSSFIKNICTVYEAQLVSTKISILHLFDGITNHALTPSLNEHIFDLMFYKTCGAIDSSDDKLLLQCIIGIDKYIDLYQEWDVNKKLLSFGIVPKLVSKLTNQDTEILLKILRCLGNLLSAEDLTINDCVIKAGILAYYPMLIVHSNKDVVKWSLWNMSNIAAGPKGSTQFFRLYNFLPMVLTLLTSGEGNVGVESLWVLANFIEDCSDEEIRWIVLETGTFEILVQCITAPKAELQSDHTRDFIYLELLRDAFRRLMYNLKYAKDVDRNGQINDSDEEDEYALNTTLDVFTLKEIRSVLTRLKEARFEDNILSLKSREDCKDLEVVNVFQDVLKRFSNLMAQHCN